MFPDHFVGFPAPNLRLYLVFSHLPLLVDERERERVIRLRMFRGRS